MRQYPAQPIGAAWCNLLDIAEPFNVPQVTGLLRETSRSVEARCNEIYDRAVHSLRPEGRQVLMEADHPVAVYCWILWAAIRETDSQGLI